MQVVTLECFITREIGRLIVSLSIVQIDSIEMDKVGLPSVHACVKQASKQAAPGKYSIYQAVQASKASSIGQRSACHARVGDHQQFENTLGGMEASRACLRRRLSSDGTLVCN